jgi:FkbM family methyltransferase
MNKQHVAAQLFLRSWPFHRGLATFVKRYFSEISFRDQIATVRTSHGFDLTIAPSDWVGRNIYLTGEFERSVIDVLRDFSQSGDTLLDIGANLGYISSAFLSLVPESSVVAVEPQPQILKLLTTNLDRFGRYQIYPYAIAESAGEALMHIDSANNGASRIVSSANTNSIKIQTRTASQMFSELRMPRLDLVKIDTEGYEEQVLISCFEHFVRLQPRAIVFEEQFRKSAPDASIGQLLAKMNYDIYAIKKTMRRSMLLKVTSASECTHNDYVAVPRHCPLPSRIQERYL